MPPMIRVGGRSACHLTQIIPRHNRVGVRTANAPRRFGRNPAWPHVTDAATDSTLAEPALVLLGIHPGKTGIRTFLFGLADNLDRSQIHARSCGVLVVDCFSITISVLIPPRPHSAGEPFAQASSRAYRGDYTCFFQQTIYSFHHFVLGNKATKARPCLITTGQLRIVRQPHHKVRSDGSFQFTSPLPASHLAVND